MSYTADEIMAWLEKEAARNRQAATNFREGGFPRVLAEPYDSRASTIEYCIKTIRDGEIPPKGWHWEDKRVLVEDEPKTAAA